MVARLAGESPAMALGRGEHVDEGKGARRNSHLLPDEGITVDGEPMRDLKEAGVQICHLSVSEPLAGIDGRARYLVLPKPEILHVTRQVYRR